jgi:transposase
MRFDLSDEDWALLEPLLPKSRKSARVDDRKIMNAIFCVLRTGMPWRNLPARYGPYTTAYNLCVPKTLSALAGRQNRLSGRNDRAVQFIPCSLDRTIQVEDPA